MSAVGITENAKGDNKKFEIWCNSREEVYIVQVHICRCFFLDEHKKNQRPEYSGGRLYSIKHVLQLTVAGIIQFTLRFMYFQAPTADVKTTWVNEIRKVLTTQLEACRGTENPKTHF